MIKIIQRDITDIGDGYTPDCIVNPSNPELTEGAGVSGAIHRATGEARAYKSGYAISHLEHECWDIHRLATGSAILCNGTDLCEYIIQTVAPREGNEDWRELLVQCYLSIFDLVRGHNDAALWKNRISDIAIPMIGTGAYGLPWQEADDIALIECLDTGMTELQIQLVIGPHTENAEKRKEVLARRLEAEKDTRKIFGTAG